jgi:hypothetical protein
MEKKNEPYRQYGLRTLFSLTTIAAMVTAIVLARDGADRFALGWIAVLFIMAWSAPRERRQRAARFARVRD